MPFEEFVASRLPALLRYAVMLTGDPHLAQDLVAEVMVRAYSRWRRIGRTEHPDRYVHRMLTNEYLSWRRRWNTRQVALVEPPPERLADAHDHAERLADQEDLWTRLGALPRRQRAVLVLRYYEGLADAEIAEVLGCTAGTVRGYASRALATLRLDLTQPAAAAPRTGTQEDT